MNSTTEKRIDDDFKLNWSLINLGYKNALPLSIMVSAYYRTSEFVSLLGGVEGMPLAQFNPPTNFYVGAGITLTGLAGTFVSLTEDDAEEIHEGILQKKGLFGQLRHPLYWNFKLFGAGVATMFPTVETLLTYGALFLATEYLERREEQTQTMMHGDNYLTYKDITPKYVPKFMTELPKKVGKAVYSGLKALQKYAA